ncbi:CDP-glycerol glycerophosphotransferase, TagB/SpsB family [Haladaptatus litoreus]|uniref:CDP-glycerol glycerophosphotransferase, TagB/SpsB family n=1 Tax=Haladaptatus litoreus TaxID=553468 RepID=A0A1N6YLN6_9EURY|nr:CDP-glycerol glycerophosphotransferase family protein [Haladaptatus litoreus]SIR15510.1 CDP-glycerol glycerophosphotransferase, TagB/SpsB family [Haladaptatus litoreus]
MKIGQSVLAPLKRSLVRPLADRIERWSPALLLQWVLYVLLERLWQFGTSAGLWTRDDTRWVFGARDGEAFVDNAKYLFLHVANERPGVRPVWLSKDRDVVRELQQAGYEAYYAYSLHGLLANLRAGVVLLTQGHRDVAMPCCAGARTVLLWHGIPLKTISWDAEFPDEPVPVRRVYEYMSNEFDRLLVPSENLAEVFESGLHIDRDRMIFADYPRLDALFSDVRGSEIGEDETARHRVRRLSRNHHVFFYLPTFRDDSERRFSAQFDFHELDDFLARTDAYFVVKTHPREQFDLPSNCERIVKLPGKFDVYPLLRYADTLVTDYSSIYFDYLALDRPVVFFPYDRDRYEKSRGFYFDYDEITAGPVASNFDELLTGLSWALETDLEKTARRELTRKLLTDVNRTGEQSEVVHDAIRRELFGVRTDRTI